MSDVVQVWNSTLFRRGVDIWYAFTTIMLAEATRDTWLSYLSHDERARYDRFKFARSRNEFLLAHVLARVMLSRVTGISARRLVFASDKNGKPTLVNLTGSERIGFNLTHSNGLVALAIATTDLVGIDVESTDRKGSIDPVIAALSKQEATNIQYLQGPDRQRSAIAHWSVREAFSKAIGLGLALPKEHVSFEFGKDGSPRLVYLDERYGDPAEWHFFHAWVTDQHVLTGAVVAKNVRNLRWRFREVRSLLGDVDEVTEVSLC